VKRLRRSAVLSGILAFLIVSAGCSVPADTMLAAAPDEELPVFLSDLSQVSDYPFYTAEYRGDYGFDAYLESGEYPVNKFEEVLADACTCFYVSWSEDGPLLGRNFDWHEHPVLLLFTDPPDGFASVSMVDISYLGYDEAHSPMDDPAGLFYAPFYAFDGMNEHGLAVGMMAVDHAEGELDPERMTLDSLELIRLMLDRARDVDEVLDLLDDYNVEFGSVPLHYIVADRSGRSVIIEYLDDVPVIIEGGNEWQTSTNFIITEVRPLGADAPCWRYNHVESELSASEGKIDSGEAMDLLEAVSQGGNMGTRWSAVYHLGDASVSIVIDRDYQHIYAFDIE